tara:strand:+ start:241 stop:780 length:540 start_codon:yes stop_codon:yes gene_type:complete
MAKKTTSVSPNKARAAAANAALGSWENPRKLGGSVIKSKTTGAWKDPHKISPMKVTGQGKGSWEDPHELAGQTVKAKPAKKTTGAWKDPHKLAGQTIKAKPKPKLPKNWRSLPTSHPARVAFRDWYKSNRGSRLTPQEDVMVAGVNISESAKKIGKGTKEIIKRAKARNRTASMKTTPK